MKMNSPVRRIVSTLLLALCLFFIPTAVGAQTSAFTYQGKLTDGANAANGSYDLQFILVDAETGGTQVSAAQARGAVNVSNGVFTVTLDFGANAFAAGANRFLQILVKKPSETNYTFLTPRQQLTASPYSIRTISAAAADSLSTACVGCVTNAQINSIDGAKVSGTVANANTANSAATATTATTADSATTAGNVTGVVAIANGGTGSSTKNFVDLTTAQTIAGAKTFSANLRTNGLVRSGSETGTSNVPQIPLVSGPYNGLVTRRINTGTATAGTIVARTNILRLERDGTAGGWRIANDASSGSGEENQSVHCLAVNASGGVVAARLQPVISTTGTTPLFTNAQNIEFMQCSFGNAYAPGHLTQVTLQRYGGDFYWTGTLTSTFNQ